MKISGVLLLLVTLTVITPGCKKTEPMGLSEYNAHLTKAGPGGPNVDELILDSSGETVVPINKIGVWPQNNQTPVSVKFIDTGDRYGFNRLRVVYIISIRPNGPEARSNP